MKLSKKLLISVISMLCAMLFVFAACGGESYRDKYKREDNPANWDHLTYIVYLEDCNGNPVANVGLLVCGNSCIPKTTNEDGRISVTFSAQQNDIVSVHFEDETYTGPEGMALPEGAQQVGIYEHAYVLNQKVTTLRFVKA